MSREFFKNLPNTTTPLNAQRMNGFLNGNEAMGSIVVDDIECKNIFDGELKKGVYLYADGTYSGGASALNGYVCSVNKTPIEAGKTLRFSTNYPSYQVGYVFYNNGTFVSSYVGRTVTVPEGANEFVVNIQKSADAEKIELSEVEWVQVEYGTEITDYVPHKKFGYNSEETMGKIVVDDISCKNLLKNTAKSKTENGVTFTVNDDGSVHVSGTATANTFLRVTENLHLPAGKYTLSGGYVNSSTFVAYQGTHSDGTTFNNAVRANGSREFELVDGDVIGFIQIRIGSGTTVDYTFKPQIEKGTVATEFTPYKSLGYTSGSNENGSWVKYDDGRMECWGNNIDIPANTESQNITLPQQFVGNYIVLTNCIYNYYKGGQIIIGAKSSSYFVANPIKASGQTADAITTFDYLAKGYWK